MGVGPVVVNGTWVGVDNGAGVGINTDADVGVATSSGSEPESDRSPEVPVRYTTTAPATTRTAALEKARRRIDFRPDWRGGDTGRWVKGPLASG